MLWVSAVRGPCKQIDLLVIIQRVLVSEAHIVYILIAFRYTFMTVNTFTEHRGSTWSVKDMQHTSVWKFYMFECTNLNTLCVQHTWRPL
jgi:uncharacterized membrane protein YkvI